MALLDAVRWMHVIGAAVLLGTGAGIAFFMLMAHRSGDVHVIAHTARTVVLADFAFTAVAVVAQPITGVWLAHLVGWRLSEPWLVGAIGLYALTGALWLPVVRIQLEIRTLAEQARHDRVPLPERYFRLFRRWCRLGVPAFIAVLAIYWLMLARPALGIASG